MLFPCTLHHFLRSYHLTVLWSFKKQGDKSWTNTPYSKAVGVVIVVSRVDSATVEVQPVTIATTLRRTQPIASLGALNAHTTVRVVSVPCSSSYSSRFSLRLVGRLFSLHFFCTPDNYRIALYSALITNS